MKICFIAPANNYHTQKWCNYFVSKNYEVEVISFTKADIPKVKVHYLEVGVSPKSYDAKKIEYLRYSRKIKKIVNNMQPDIISVHYASSYGLCAAISGLKGYYLSIWGSDIFEFPRKSFLHRIIIKYSLKRAKYILSTSEFMANEAKKYTNKDIYVTHWGVDTDLFKPIEQKKDKFIIGTIKGLDKKYGIDYLLKAFALFLEFHKTENIELRIAGTGKDEKELKELSKKLGIEKKVVWLGFISQAEAAKEWARMDIGVVYSSCEESFGISAIEANSCGVPLIISNAGGLLEATIPGETSVVVTKENEELLCNAMENLYNNAQLRKELSLNGRKNVIKNYSLEDCFAYIEKIFNKH